MSLVVQACEPERLDNPGNLVSVSPAIQPIVLADAEPTKKQFANAGSLRFYALQLLPMFPRVVEFHLRPAFHRQT